MWCDWTLRINYIWGQKMKENNPIFSAYNKWYFWDESWSDYYGPYETEDDAKIALNEYTKKVLG